MSKNNIIIRPETERDYRNVENHIIIRFLNYLRVQGTKYINIKKRVP